MTKYLTRDIFEHEPQWAEPVLQTLDWPIDVLETLGVAYGETDYEEPAFREKFKYVDAERPNVKAVIDFFNTKKGRYDYFWVPTWSSDIVVTASFSAAAIQLTIQDIDYAETYLDNDVTGRHVFILFPDNTYVCRKIIAAPTGTTITLDSAIGKAISSEDLPQLLVSFLHFSRFDADEVKVDYSNLDTASINLSFKAIPAEAFTTTTTTTTTTTSTSSTSTVTTTTVPYMSGWDNRIKLTIDHDKVDAALEYFPVHVHLSNSSGITSQDVRGIFDEVGTNSKKIAITTEDGQIKLFVEIERWDETNNEAWMWVRVPSLSSTVDTILYLYYDNDVGDQNVRTIAEAGDTFTGSNDALPNQELWRVFTGTPTIQGNQLRLQATAVPVQDSVYSRINVTGDFDIQVDYSIPSPPSGIRSWQLMLRIRIDINNSVSIGRWGNDTGQDYLKDARIGGTPTYDHSAPTTDTSGKLRITRTGSTWHAYYWSGSAWVEVGTGSAVGSGSITSIEICSNTWTNNPAYTGYVDNFIINSAGTITGFVDDTLGKSAQEVWDANFKLVCHMAQDPNGDVADAIKDSTRNVLHGTPAGTMLTADLVDGKVGKCLELDGVDDNIGCGSDALLDDIEKITIESIFNATGWGEGSYGRIISKSTSFNESGYNVFLYSGDDRFCYIHGWATTDGTWLTPVSSISLSTWYHAVVQYDRLYGVGDKPIIYLNSILQTVTTLTPPVGSIESDAAQNVCIGSRAETDREFDGEIDEVRISDVYRSAAWIKATYNTIWDSLITFESAPGSTTTTTTTSTTTTTTTTV